MRAARAPLASRGPYTPVMDVEIAVRRIGGLEGPRIYGGYRTSQVDPRHTYSEVHLDARESPQYWLSVGLRDWTRADDEFLTCRARLLTMDGQLIGQRPALLYAAPYDVPTYTSFLTEDLGLFSLSMRLLDGPPAPLAEVPHVCDNNDDCELHP